MYTFVFMCTCIFSYTPNIYIHVQYIFLSYFYTPCCERRTRTGRTVYLCVSSHVYLCKYMYPYVYNIFIFVYIRLSKAYTNWEDYIYVSEYMNVHAYNMFFSILVYIQDSYLYISGCRRRARSGRTMYTSCMYTTHAYLYTYRCTHMYICTHILYIPGCLRRARTGGTCACKTC